MKTRSNARELARLRRQGPSRFSRRTRSILLSARIAGRVAALQPLDDAPRVRVDAPRAASTSSTVTSASAAPAQAAATIARSSRRRGAKMPGVSTKTSCVVAVGGDAEQAAARRLHLRRDDGELLADEPIEQRRFAGVGRADQRDIAAACRTIRRVRSLSAIAGRDARASERRRGPGFGGALR